MIPTLRRSQILEILQASGLERLPGLAQKMGISESTLRRDLKELALRGEVELLRGGGVRMRKENIERGINEKILLNREEKERLERRRQESPFIILFHQNAQRAQASPNDQIDWFHIRPILQSIYLCSKRQCKFRSATTFRMIRTKFRKSVAFRDGGCLS